MSKVDAQRALRDARYAAYRASRAAAGVPVDDAPPPPLRVRSAEPKPSGEPERPAAASPAAAPSEAVTGAVTEVVNEEVAGDAAPALCGHRNIGNKTCRRPAGHPEKNHRYT